MENLNRLNIIDKFAKLKILLKFLVLIYAFFLIFKFTELFIIKENSGFYFPKGTLVSFVREEKGNYAIYNYNFKRKEFEKVYESKNEISDLNWGIGGSRLEFKEFLNGKYKYRLLNVRDRSLKDIKWKSPNLKKVLKEYEKDKDVSEIVLEGTYERLIPGKRYNFIIYKNDLKKSNFPETKGLTRDFLIADKKNREVEKIKNIVDFSISDDERYILYTTFLSKKKYKWHNRVLWNGFIDRFKKPIHEIFFYDLKDKKTKFLTRGEVPSFFNDSKKFLFLYPNRGNDVNIIEFNINSGKKIKIGQIFFLNREYGEPYLLPDLKTLFFLKYNRLRYEENRWDKLIEIDFNGNRHYLLGGIKKFAVKYGDTK